MAANWSEIPDELAYLVGERLVSVDDFVRFGVVCKPWRRAVSTVKKEHPFSPLIMLAKADNDILPTNDENDKGIRTFIVSYGGQEDKTRIFDVEVPKAQGRRCWGSTYGWVVTAGLDLSIHLLNPLTGVQIPLPPQPTLQRLSNAFNQKFVVGWNPSSSSSSSSKGEWIVMAIFGMYSSVAFTTCIVPENGIEAAASSSWKFVQTPFGFCADVLFLGGGIFIIDKLGVLSVCNINKTTPKAILIGIVGDSIDTACPKAMQVESHPRYYLVEICGCVRLVARFFQRFTGRDRVDYYSQTKCFKVYRFKYGENKCYGVPDLGEYALFVGNHSSFAISTIIYPDFKSNSIYFTDDFREGYESPYCDSGVFNYKEGTIEKFDFTNHGAFSKFSRPIFYVPAF